MAAKTQSLFTDTRDTYVPPGARARHWQYPQDFGVYEIICSHARPGVSCTISVHEMQKALRARGSKRSQTSIRKTIKRLEAMNMIHRRAQFSRNQARTADLYVLQPEEEWI